MTHSLKDLNAHLFDQLARLSGENMTADQITQEAQRADAIVSLADQITRNADLQLKAAKLFAEHGTVVLPMLPQIAGPSK